MRTTQMVWMAALMLLAVACGPEVPNFRKLRADRVREAEGDILVGASWMWGKKLDLMREGMEMALDEVNARGVLNGRKIQVLWRDDNEDLKTGLAIAKELSDSLDVVAVIGHSTSSISIPAAAVYDSMGVLMLAPGATHVDLIREKFQYIFRTIPSDQDAGRQLAKFAGLQGFRRMAIYSLDDEYGRGLAKFFANGAQMLGILISDRRVYEADGTHNFRPVLESWKALRLDAIFLAATMPQGAEIIAQAREVGMTLPVLGSDGLDSPELWRIAGKAAEGTVVFSVFHPGDPRTNVKDFVAAFQSAYGKVPDVWAALGYDTVKLLAEAIKRAGTTVPGDVAAALRKLQDWYGVTGTHNFGQTGELLGKPIIKKIARNGKFEYVPEGFLR